MVSKSCTKPRLILGTAFDFILFGMVLGSMIWLLYGPLGAGVSNKIIFLKYFTVLSNIMLGAVALFVLAIDLLMLIGKMENAPAWVPILYIVANTGTAITFLTVMFFLGPTLGYDSMFEGPNIFMHVITPLAAWVRILLLENTRFKFRWQYAFYGTLPLGLYGLFYLINVAVNNGYGKTQYDWYGFGSAGLGVGILSYFLMLGFAFGLTWLFLFAQNKINKRLK